MEYRSSIRSFLALALLSTVCSGALAEESAPPADIKLPDETVLRARYALPDSRFIDVDGEPIHVVDEGRGPAIVLIHGSYASLRQWDGWVRTLSRKYRVIRFDRPSMGLSGPNPSGEYSVEREIHVIDAITRSLGAERFVLVATSSGGAAGVGFAAEHPGRVTGLILNNIAVPPFEPNTSDRPPELKAALAADLPLGGYHRPEYWRQVLRYNFVDKGKVTTEMVAQWTDMNNRRPAMPRSPNNPNPLREFDRTGNDLARISAPSLVIWSAEDHDTPLAMGEKVLPLLASTDKTFVVIPRCGHMMPMECGGEGLALAEPFLARVAHQKVDDGH